MKPRTVTPSLTSTTVDHVDVHLRGLRALRVAMTRNRTGEPEQVTMTVGWLDPWRPGISIDLPAAAIGDLRAALAELDAA